MSDDPDLKPGIRVILGQHLFTAEEIIAFARKYDPQVFHLDAEAAKNTVFGGLCASGWHTASTWMGCNVRFLAARAAERAKEGLPPLRFGPSPGFRNLRWHRPVFAGATITFAHTNTHLRATASMPGWSVLEGKAEAWNEKDEPVMTFDSAVMIQTG
jgi:Acyl dehydratase